jgi:hypothetical protein
MANPAASRERDKAAGLHDACLEPSFAVALGGRFFLNSSR